jgi:hypothetical protein
MHHIISNGKLSRETIRELTKPFTISAIKDDKPKCKRCGSTENILLSGYCLDCEEELEKLVK